jgi:hypothetical protein
LGLHNCRKRKTKIQKIEKLTIVHKQGLSKSGERSH